jgi:hypothetical protein
MKKPTVALTFLVLLTFSASVLMYSFITRNHIMQQLKSNGQPGFAVVELFTSEGCSSCPAAEKAVAALFSQKLEHIYILSFHVDYWNRLGWTDPFSQVMFSERQKSYATAFSLQSIYTPQIVVNGKSEFVGSNVSKLQMAVEKALSGEAPSDLKITTTKSGNAVTVSYTLSKPHAECLNVALVQPEAFSHVKGGENGGKTLHHVNVVSVFRTIEVTGNGYLTLEIPPTLSNLPLQVIAFSQSKENYNILGADAKNL